MSVISPEKLRKCLGSSLADQTLIPAEDAQLLVARLVREGTDASMAERVMYQALVFMALCTMEPKKSFRPSEEVDKGWHELITDTQVYDALTQVLGMFVHHVPCDKTDEVIPLDKALEAMDSHQLPIDESLWATPNRCPESSSPTCSSVSQPR